jgi:hypothetical protein
VENVSGNIAVLDPDFRLALVQSLAALEDEGHAVPALVVDAEAGGGKRRGHRSLRNCRIIQISGSAVVIWSQFYEIVQAEIY